MLLQLFTGIECCLAMLFWLCSLVEAVYSNAISKGGLKGGRSGAMLLSIATAQCHAGASGGAVVNAGGHTVGITTSNARHAASGSTKTNLIFAVAVDALQPLWTLAE